MYETGGGSSIELWMAERDEEGISSELQRLVWEELRWEPGLEDCDLQVYVAGHVVTLIGTVRSYPLKVAAERAVMRVPRVTAVENCLDVVPVPHEARIDAELAEEVRRVLTWDAEVPHDRVQSTVAEGHVTLLGEVDWDHQRAAAERAVMPLAGVRGLANLIRVRPLWQTGEFRPQVEAALRRVHPHGRVRFEAVAGRVILRGHVRSLAERDVIEHTIRQVPGVTAVQDDLTIEA